MQAAVHTRETRPAMTARRKISAYLALTKPRVIELLLVVTAPTMILAQKGLPDLWLLLATLIGGAMSAGSAGAFNCYIDRDIDRVMKRTQRRPLVTGELTDREALVFAYGLGAASIVWLWVFTNWLAAVLSLGAILLYVVFYSLILKRRTSQNIVWGGVAGCMPVLIGWAAVTESLSWTPFILFLIIFLWTPPHYWPLSMKYRDDYAAAGVPMLAVVRGRAQVGLQVILYAWATVAGSLLLIRPFPSSPAPGSSTRRTGSTTSRSVTRRSPRCGCSTARSRTCRSSSSLSASTRCCRSELRGRMPHPARGARRRRHGPRRTPTAGP
jgi:protoheme IX farnesyltransferase